MSLYIAKEARQYGDPCYVVGQERTKNVIYRLYDLIWDSGVFVKSNLKHFSRKYVLIHVINHGRSL